MAVKPRQQYIWRLSNGPTLNLEKGQTQVRRPVSRVLSPPEGDGWPFLWDVRHRTPRATDPGGGAETPLPVTRRAAPIWSCSRWGLPCRFRCRSRGGLLPHRFTLARRACRSRAGLPGGLFSVALSLGSPPPVVNRHRVSVEPGLSSPSRSPGKAQPSSRLTCGVLTREQVPTGQATRLSHGSGVPGIT
jgi:hypothetical protein